MLFRSGDVKFGRSPSFLLRRRCRPEWERRESMSACSCRFSFGVLPSVVFMALSFLPGSSSGSWRCQIFFKRRLPWWRMTGGGGSGKSFFNKLVAVLNLRVGVVEDVAMVAGETDAAGDFRLAVWRQLCAGLLWQGLLVDGGRLRSSFRLRLELATARQR